MMVVPEIMNPGRCVDECIPLDFIISAISIPVCWFSTVYFSTAAAAVGSRIILFCTVSREFGRQFISFVLDSLLPRQHKMTVQKSKDSIPTVISNADFSELTVEYPKAFKNTAAFVTFS